MELPTGIIKREEVNPITLVMYSKPKVGKTSLLSLLDDCLIIDFEKGTKYVDSMKIEVNNLKDFKELIKLLHIKKKETGKLPYTYIALDTVTEMEDIAKEYALEIYKASTIGKNFKDTDILSLPNGAGYGPLRTAFFALIDFLKPYCKYLILSGHLKDKRLNDDNETVDPASIDLTGKIKTMTCSKADAIAYVFRRDNKTIMSFIGNDEILCGARSEHLRNREIEVAEMLTSGSMVSYWDRIYLKK